MSTLKNLRQHAPLIVCITNDVVKDITANGTLSLGASPIMSNEKAEAQELMKVAGGLVINIGTADMHKKDLMHEMMSEANKNGVPIVLDPVGYGASSFRKNLVNELIREYNIALIKGNASEIYALAGEEGESKGVDSTEGTGTPEISMLAFEKLDVPVLVTGEQDSLVTGAGLVTMDNGHGLLGRITGSGCLLGTIASAFLAVDDDFQSAIIDAVSYFNLSAERAADAISRMAPGSFRMGLIDELYLNGDELLKKKSVTYHD